MWPGSRTGPLRSLVVAVAMTLVLPGDTTLHASQLAISCDVSIFYLHVGEDYQGRRGASDLGLKG